MVKHRLVKASCVPNRCHWESTLHYGPCLPGLCVACRCGWWDTESSHFFSLVLLFKLSPVRKLQSFCALQLPSIQDRSPWAAHPLLETPGTLLQFCTEYLDSVESLVYTGAIGTPRVCIWNSFLQTEVRGHQKSTKPSMLTECAGCIKDIFSQGLWICVTKW